MNARMQQTLLGLQEAYARQAARLDKIRRGQTPSRKPTVDDLAGMSWFNSISEERRAYWLQRARSSRPVDAWHYYRLCLEAYGQRA
jgi:hypothetical protein